MLWLFITLPPPKSPCWILSLISLFFFPPFCFHSVEAFEVSVQQVKLFSLHVTAWRSLRLNCEAIKIKAQLPIKWSKQTGLRRLWSINPKKWVRNSQSDVGWPKCMLLWSGALWPHRCEIQPTLFSASPWEQLKPDWNYFFFCGQLTISVSHHISMHISRAQKHCVIGCVRVMVGFHKSKASRQWCMSKLAREWVCKWVNSWVTLRQWEGRSERRQCPRRPVDVPPCL